jgi:hypothetical protein
MAEAVYTVEVSFNASAGGAGVFQDTGQTLTTFAEFGGEGEYAPQQSFAASTTDVFGGAYDDVTIDVTDMLVRRGRDDTGGPFQPGECSFTLQRPAEPLDAPTQPGGRELYNPASTQSPLSPQFAGDPADKQSPGISPLRPVRVQMSVGGTSRVLFFGYVTSWRYDRETGAAKVLARDLLWRLSKTRPEFQYEAGETTASAIGRLLDDANWRNPADRNLNPVIQGVASGVGDVLAEDSLEPDGESRSAFQIIDELLEVNNGVFYIRGKDARYENRTARSLRKVPEFVVDDVALEYDPGFEVE